MERLYDLFFELSNDDRMRILLALREEPMNLTALSRKLGTTNQQCMRHLNRLAGMGAARKDSEGLYNLTPYGDLVLRMVPGFEFVSAHRDYFSSHTLRELPTPFVGRLGELEGSIPTPDVMVAISRIESLFRRAEEYIWIAHDQYILSTVSLAARAVERGVSLRDLEPANKMDPLRRIQRDVDEGDEEVLLEAKKSGQIVGREAESVHVFCYLSERDAVIAFPRDDGVFDYLCFSTQSEGARRWCQDLYQHLWDEARELSNAEYVEQHLDLMKKKQ